MNDLPQQPLDLLLVEDNQGDVRLTKEFLCEGGIDVQLHVVPDGIEALAYLRREGRYKTSPTPHLVLLDLHLPRRDGWEVLAEIDRDVALRQLPVVILASDPDERGLLARAPCCVVGTMPKPPCPERLQQVLASLQQQCDVLNTSAQSSALDGRY
jgi:CheY-like chemotaxis protein